MLTGTVITAGGFLGINTLMATTRLLRWRPDHMIGEGRTERYASLMARCGITCSKMRGYIYARHLREPAVLLMRSAVMQWKPIFMVLVL
jgi:hypothetical protein